MARNKIVMRTTSQSRLKVLATMLTVPALMLIMLTAVLSAGCTFVPVKPAPKAGIDPALDPCASRLHDIAGSLLLYYATHNALPPDLTGVKQAGGEACPPLQCPLSGEPYVYNPMGIEIRGLPGLVVLHDATACHDGNKWGLVASQMGPGKPLQVQVMLLPAGAIPAPPALGGPGIK